MAAEEITPVSAAASAAMARHSAGAQPASQAVGQGASNEHAFITVRELMRLESEQALAIARQRRRQGSEPSLSSVRAGEGGRVAALEPLRLVGIYGVGKRLFAEVRSGPQAWLFLNGHSLPVGHTAGAALYRLKEVAGACVRLDRQGDETTLCLPRAGRQ